MTFKRNYFLATITLFVIEVLIACFLNDNFIRPYFGDVLVVILIYCFIMTFLNFSYWVVALFVLLFAFFVETLQYLNFIELLGLQNNKVARAIIGTSFSWKDMLCYTVGILIVIIIERIRIKPKGSA